MTLPRHRLVLRAGAVVLAVLGLLPVANLITARDVPWWRAGVLLWVIVGGLLVAVAWAVAARWGDALAPRANRVWDVVLRAPHRAFVMTVSAGTAMLTAFVAWYCYAGRGFTGDELATAWHARMLLAGRLSIPMPPHPEFFDIVAMVGHGPRWYSQYPIGGPMLHALGLSVGAEWLVNPLLMGVAAWQLHRFVRRAFGNGTARATALLFALSPFVLVLGATQLTHAPVLALTMLSLAELAAWDAAATERSRMRHASALGAALGLIALMRPLDAVLVAIPVGLFQLVATRNERARWRSLLLETAALAIPVALLLLANARTTGSPLVFAYDVANGPSHGIGFHLDPTGAMHTPLRGLRYVSGYLMRLDRFLFEWPLPALLVVVTTLALLVRATRWDSLLLSLVGTFLIGYGAYWFPGFLDGPRFLFPIVPVFVLYAARLPEAVTTLWSVTARRVMTWMVPLCVLFAWTVPLPFSSAPARLSALRDQRTKLKTNVSAQAKAAALGNALVLVREPWRGRLLARVRSLGVQQFEAEQVVNSVDACALQLALDDVDRLATPDTATRRAWVFGRARDAGAASLTTTGPADERVARALRAPSSPRCIEEQQGDTIGTMPFAIFLATQHVSREGQLDGTVVWARDLGARDSLLMAEYGNRAWYRYLPGRSAADDARFVRVR